MAMNNTSVDSYLLEGCGRCDNFQTPDCKVHLWTDALVALRELLLESELTEEMKWGQPTYSLDGKNVLLMSSMKDSCALNFFKGAGFEDPYELLEKPGPNSRFARYLKFTSADEVFEKRDQTEAFIAKAIAFERSGKTIDAGEGPQMPAELEERLSTDSELQQAFDDLTPGRQRGYFIHIGGAKQSSTRSRRVEKCIPKILAGKGYNER